MTQHKFTRPIISSADKEKKAEEFMGFMDKAGHDEKTMGKEETKLFSFRIPLSLYGEIREVAHLTGISINAVCLETIRPGIRKKIKELKCNDDVILY